MENNTVLELKETTFKCDYCGEQRPINLRFKIFVVEIDLSEEYSQQACPDCISTFFTETPENVKFASISRVEERTNASN